MTLEVASRLIQDATAAKLAGHQQKIAAHRQKLAQTVLGTEALAQVSEGFHIWLPLPDGWRADVFCADCARLGVRVNEGRSFALKAGDAPEAIRICISHEPDEERLRRGLEAIDSVLRQKPSGSSMTI
jgi:DNA-binding transcriptional MocR family regulator